MTRLSVLGAVKEKRMGVASLRFEGLRNRVDGSFDAGEIYTWKPQKRNGSWVLMSREKLLDVCGMKLGRCLL